MKLCVCFHDRKSKFVKTSLFRSFHEASTVIHCFTFICGRAYYDKISKFG